MSISSSEVMHALPVLLPLGVCTFVGLFAYDVYRTNRAAEQPQRMFSELAFNGLLHLCTILALFAIVNHAASWLRETSWTVSSLAISLLVAAIGALRVAAQRAAELPADPVPDFMRCDGEFVAPPGDSLVNPLASWCGWIRFEGHGSCRVQRSAASCDWMTCEWHVRPGCLQICMPVEGRPPHAATELYVREGDAADTIDVSLSADGAPVCRFTFVPEEGAME